MRRNEDKESRKTHVKAHGASSTITYELGTEIKDDEQKEQNAGTERSEQRKDKESAKRSNDSLRKPRDQEIREALSATQASSKGNHEPKPNRDLNHRKTSCPRGKSIRQNRQQRRHYRPTIQKPNQLKTR